jgi:chromosome segregation ATPase
MKNIIGAAVLVLICIALGIALLVRNKQASEEKKTDTVTILELSNKWVDTSVKLQEQKQVNDTLESDVKARKEEGARLTNQLVQTSASLSKTEENLAKTAEELALARKTAQEEMARRDARIAELESQNQSLDRQALDLNAALTNLNTQILDTQRKLAASEGDKAFLEKELKRLMGEKAELERQFNDLQVLRAQVSKLKEELSIARRLEWIRKGLFAADEQKGSQKLMQGPTSPAQQTNLPAHYDLNVEVGADGSVRVIPPLTNRPPSNNPPPK